MTYIIVVSIALLIAVPIVVWLESDHPDQPPRRRPSTRKNPRP